MKLRCRFGIHKWWTSRGVRRRMCRLCKRIEQGRFICGSGTVPPKLIWELRLKGH